MKEERLFQAIGGADPILLERSEKAVGRTGFRIRRGIAAAACLALVLSLAALSLGRPGEAGTETNTIHLLGPEAGAFHLLQLCYAAEPESRTDSDFILYINQERYQGREENGAYVIRPVLPGPAGLPECSLEITRRDLSPEEAAEAVAGELKKDYAYVTEPEEHTRPDGLLLRGNDGTEWNAAQADVWLVDDRQGGTFVLTSCYFTEAVEGHGARFSDMAGTFQVFTEENCGPAWLEELRETTDLLMEAVFQNEVNETACLAENGAVEGYGTDVSGDVSIRAVDYTVDSDQEPKRAVVSVRHRLSTEDSDNYLTLELVRENGRWLAAWGGIEK